LQFTNHTHGFSTSVHEAATYLCTHTPTVAAFLPARWHLRIPACSILVKKGLGHTTQVTSHSNQHPTIAVNACMLNVVQPVLVAGMVSTLHSCTAPQARWCTVTYTAIQTENLSLKTIAPPPVHIKLVVAVSRAHRKQLKHNAQCRRTKSAACHGGSQFPSRCTAVRSRPHINVFIAQAWQADPHRVKRPLQSNNLTSNPKQHINICTPRAACDVKSHINTHHAFHQSATCCAPSPPHVIARRCCSSAGGTPHKLQAGITLLP
jgi:hypothetical protein